ncbi:MAG TPA: ATP-binding cassette domain-containing protein [Stellaceae bacterium]|nr:ATP-binding cassette domain-containing protein [Stellaceae bacterium]
MSLALDAVDVDIGAISIIRGAAIALQPGTMVGLIGRNGAGKTTLLRSIMGFLPPRRGSIRFKETELTRLDPYERARHGIGYMPEDRRLVPDFTVEDNILLPVWATRRADAAQRLAWVYDLMSELGQLARRPAGTLSGGQQKLVALARALVCGSDLLLLDEPTEGLAPALARRLGEVLAKLKGTGLTVLVADSNLVHLGDLLDDVFIIERGAVTKRQG